MLEITVLSAPHKQKYGYIKEVKSGKFLSAAETDSHTGFRNLTFQLEDGLYEVQSAIYGHTKMSRYAIVVSDGEITKEGNLTDLLLDGLEMPELEGSERSIDYAHSLLQKDCAKYLDLGLEKLQKLVNQCQGKSASKVIDACKSGKFADVLFRMKAN